MLAIIDSPESEKIFAGTSAKFDKRYVRQSSFFFAVAAFLFAAVRMLMLPAVV